MKTITGFKFIKEDMCSNIDTDTKWKKGIWKEHDGQIELCVSGYHACRFPLESLKYVYGPRWFIVEARGEIKEDKGDKFVASEMRLLTELPTKKILVEFSVKCAERCLKNFERLDKNDKRPHHAIEAAKTYLKNPCKATQDAASSAARSASSAASAAWSASSAASYAAWSAAMSAASAAMSAASAASYAAWSAARSASSAARFAASAARSAASAASYAAWSADAAASATKSNIRKWQCRTLLKIISRYR